MGFNISGLLIKSITNEKELENALNATLDYQEEVDFEAATTDKEENVIDVLQTETGTLILVPFGQMYDLSILSAHSEAIQFIISEVSDTYYFEKYDYGELSRKLITSQGAVEEDTGKGLVTENDDLADKIWEFSDEYLKNDFNEQMFDLKFKRYQLS